MTDFPLFGVLLTIKKYTKQGVFPDLVYRARKLKNGAPKQVIIWKKAERIHMEVIDGHWYMEGVAWDDERCVKSCDELLDVICKIGFLPLFANGIEGFSVESMTDPSCWWTGDAKRDPWEWRIVLTKTEKIAYGKFFGNKAGFISKKWFPYFANYRREGYDFDSRYEDGKADSRAKLLMDLFIPQGMDMWEIKKQDVSKAGCSTELFTYEMKEKAGFCKGGQKNFEGVCSRLQMQTYLVAKDFRSRLNKGGEEYGWPVAQLTLPEYIWGYDHVTGQYKESPQESRRKIVSQIEKHFGDAGAKELKKLI